ELTTKRTRALRYRGTHRRRLILPPSTCQPNADRARADFPVFRRLASLADIRPGPWGGSRDVYFFQSGRRPGVGGAAAASSCFSSVLTSVSYSLRSLGISAASRSLAI